MPEPSRTEHDVVVVGSGLAGSTAAIALARTGLSVALLEAHRDPESYKRLCTHFIQSSALPTLQRLDLDTRIEAAGGVRNRGRFWTRFGWVDEPEPRDRPSHGYNIRRKVLDPLVRAAAAEEPNVSLVLGAKVRHLVTSDAGRVEAVVATVDGVEHTYGATLVVGADGKNSTVAELAGLEAKEIPNQRFGYFASFRDVGFDDDAPARVWLLDPDAAYAFQNEDGITLLATMPDKKRMEDFAEDREAALLSTFEGLPDAPDLSRAERVSDVVGTRDYPSIKRRRITAPGLALVGDAAMVGDPLWGLGCGWAFQSADWLSAAVSAAVRSGDPKAVDAAVRRYGRTHKRRLGGHQMLAVDFSSGRSFNPLERLIFAGAVHDPRVADRFYAFGTRNASPAALFSPRLLVRAARARRKASAAT